MKHKESKTWEEEFDDKFALFSTVEDIDGNRYPTLGSTKSDGDGEYIEDLADGDKEIRKCLKDFITSQIEKTRRETLKRAIEVIKAEGECGGGEWSCMVGVNAIEELEKELKK